MNDDTQTQTPVVYDAFKFQPAGEPLRPMVFGAICPCGQTVFSVTGLALTVDVPAGQDLVAVCHCGKTHSVTAQATEAKKNAEAAQAAPAEPAAE